MEKHERTREEYIKSIITEISKMDSEKLKLFIDFVLNLKSDEIAKDLIPAFE
jgi:hypothetical protein